MRWHGIDFDALPVPTYLAGMRQTRLISRSLVALGIALALPVQSVPSPAQTGRGPESLEPGPRAPAMPPGTSAPRRADPAPGQAPRTPTKKAGPPDTPEAREKALANLYAHLATAADPGEATAVASAIEMIWVQSGSDTISLLLARATQAISEKRLDLARELFDAVVDLAPDFAEGFARRAFLHYTENDNTRALGDLRRALALEPNHYRALDGLATILKEIGEKRAALKALKQLELVHPHWPGLEEALREMERAVEGQGI